MNRIIFVLAIGLISIINVKAQMLAEMPSASFQSTSSFIPTTSTSAVIGYESADDYYDSHIRSNRSQPRRIGGGDDEGGGWGDEEDIPEVGTPIGDGAWTLLLMVMCFARVRQHAHKRSNDHPITFG